MYMISVVLYLPLTLFSPQDDTPHQVREFIRNLESEDIGVRERATQELVKLGPKAYPALKKATLSTSAELSSRARRILQIIPLRQKLSPTLLKGMPGIAERLSLGKDRKWAETYLDLCEKVAPGPKGFYQFTSCEKEDLAFLLERALRGAKSGEERTFILGTAAKARVVLPRLLVERLAEDRVVEHRRGAAYLCGRIVVPGREKLLTKLLADIDGDVRAAAVRAAGQTKIATLSREILPRLGDPLSGVRHDALDTLMWLEAQGVAKEVSPLLKDEEAAVRAKAAEVMEYLLAERAIEDISPLLKDPNRFVRMQVAASLCRLGSSRGLDVLLGGLTMGREESRRNILEREYASSSFSWQCEPAQIIGLFTLVDRKAKYRLERWRFELGYQGSISALLKLLSEEGGVTIHMPKEPTLKERRWLDSEGTVWNSDEDPSLMDLLEGLSTGPFDLLLEGNTVRLLHKGDGLRYWKRRWSVKD